MPLYQMSRVDGILSAPEIYIEIPFFDPNRQEIE